MDTFDVSLESVSLTDIRFLFNLLKERDPQTNISHKKMPTYLQHEKFVKSKPYKKWYIIKSQSNKVGSIYLSEQDEIGIFLKKDVQGKNIGNQALEILMKKSPKQRYLANVNPNNSKSISFFEKNGFKLIQYTYELEKNS